VTVKPHHGAQVPAVAADDVKVYHKGQRDMVSSWVPLQGDRAGLQLFILIDDTSRSNLALQYSTIDEFIEAQPATTAIGVGYMRNGTVFTAQNLSTDHTLAKKALRLPLGVGAAYTSPYLALSDLMKKWPETKDRREILMITSGIILSAADFPMTHSPTPTSKPLLTARNEADSSSIRSIRQEQAAAAVVSSARIWHRLASTCCRKKPAERPTTSDSALPWTSLRICGI